jgi:tungstate transport system permease protein
VVSAVHSLQAIPAVCVGLAVYLLLARAGPLGDLRLLFTQTAMVVGQMVLGFPLLLALSHSALQAADRRAWETARTLGAPPWRAMFTVMREVRFALLAAVIAAFARIVAEVGASLMLGGNIEHVTRNIPTAIALETSKGEFAQGIALGLTLFALALSLNFALNLLHGKGEMR